jgi:hypothetical protein
MQSRYGYLQLCEESGAIGTRRQMRFEALPPCRRQGALQVFGELLPGLSAGRMTRRQAHLRLACQVMDIAGGFAKCNVRTAAETR